MDWNSSKGPSAGVLSEGGVTLWGFSFSGGKEVMKSTRTGAVDVSKVGFAGWGPVTLFASGGATEIGGLVGGDSSGWGGYISVSLNGCCGKE
jgi:hypothetical protein